MADRAVKKHLIASGRMIMSLLLFSALCNRMRVRPYASSQLMSVTQQLARIVSFATAGNVHDAGVTLRYIFLCGSLSQPIMGKAVQASSTLEGMHDAQLNSNFNRLVKR